MKYITATILLIIWLAATLFLVCTLVGIVIPLLVDEWNALPKKLIKVFEV